MTRTALYVFFGAAFLLLLAFATGSAAFLAPACLLFGTLLYALLSVLLASRDVRLSASLRDERVRRGEETQMEIAGAMKSFLPVAPLVLHVRILPGEEAQVMEIPCTSQGVRYVLPIPSLHAGVLTPGIEQCEVVDLFGLFRRSLPQFVSSQELLVLPVPFEVTPLAYAQLDAGLGTMARATEDITSPADIRSYQSGDPMKKIHWKLSLRKQELLVRRFDEPVLPDALVLLDCEVPRANDSPGLRDALLETALSVMLCEMHRDHTLHLPLMGVQPTETNSRMGETLVAEHLARLVMREGSSFEEVLLMEKRRLRGVGATVVISSYLSGDMVEIMRDMRRFGPTLRLYYVTPDPGNEEILPFIHRLQTADCEVLYVTPAGLAAPES
ncbi:MAG: DUF58 domain-containing protein [Clostridia bacterium]|nr:DUF58 domain-containing protein [Clostridia bacterium]